MVNDQPTVSPRGRYTIAQAATLLGVCENTLRNWIKGGVFKSSEYNRRGVGRCSTYIYGAALIRVWRINY